MNAVSPSTIEDKRSASEAVYFYFNYPKRRGFLPHRGAVSQRSDPGQF